MKIYVQRSTAVMDRLFGLGWYASPERFSNGRAGYPGAYAYTRKRAIRKAATQFGPADVVEV